MKNYVELYNRFAWRKSFMYVDTEDYNADQLFIQHKVRVRFKCEYGKKKCNYIMIFASCRKSDWDKAKAALEELPNKMLIMGHNDYEDYCEGLIHNIEEERDKRLQRTSKKVSAFSNK